MSDHVLDRVADYLHARLEDADRAAFEAHLTTCDACTTEMAFARELHAAVERADLHHVATDRIVALADRDTIPTPREQEHLSRCEDCQRELRGLRAYAAPTHESGSILSLARWTPVLAVAAVLLFMVLPRPDQTLRDLVAGDPLPVRLTRLPADAESFLEAWQSGLEAYRSSAYSQAVVELKAATRRDPSAVEAWIYLGSSYLQLDQPHDAARVLERALDLEPNRAQEETSRWLLADAALARSDAAGARTQLERVRDLQGRYADRAADRLARLDSR